MYDWKLPEIVDGMASATLENVYIGEGDTLKAGSKLFDISVDLSSAFTQECPPISYFRVIVREPVHVRRIHFKPGQTMDVGAVVALFASDPEEDPDAAAERPVRIATAGIMHHAGMWTASH